MRFSSRSAACIADVTGALLLVFERVREPTDSLNTNEGLMSNFTQAAAAFCWETEMCKSGKIAVSFNIAVTYLLGAQTLGFETSSVSGKGRPVLPHLSSRQIAASPMDSLRHQIRGLISV